MSLTVTAYIKMRSKRALHFCWSKKGALAAEILLTVLIFLFPWAYLWKHMMKHHFGLVGSTCWIKIYNESCIEVGRGELYFTSVIVLLQSGWFFA